MILHAERCVWAQIGQAAPSHGVKSRVRSASQDVQQGTGSPSLAQDSESLGRALDLAERRPEPGAELGPERQLR